MPLRCPAPSEELTDAIRRVATGQRFLNTNWSPRSCNPTVRKDLSNAMSKLGARNRIGAIRIAREAGWL